MVDLRQQRIERNAMLSGHAQPHHMRDNIRRHMAHHFLLYHAIGSRNDQSNARRHVALPGKPTGSVARSTAPKKIAPVRLRLRQTRRIGVAASSSKLFRAGAVRVEYCQQRAAITASQPSGETRCELSIGRCLRSHYLHITSLIKERPGEWPCARFKSLLSSWYWRSLLRLPLRKTRVLRAPSI